MAALGSQHGKYRTEPNCTRHQSITAHDILFARRRNKVTDGKKLEMTTLVTRPKGAIASEPKPAVLIQIRLRK